MKNVFRHIPLFAMMLVFATAAEARDPLGNFEIQDLMLQYNQAETLSSSLKELLTQPMPKEYTATSTMATKWNDQTRWIESLRSRVDSYVKNLKQVLRDSLLTKSEQTEMSMAFLTLQTTVKNEAKARTAAIDCEGYAYLCTRYKSAAKHCTPLFGTIFGGPIIGTAR